MTVDEMNAYFSSLSEEERYGWLGVLAGAGLVVIGFVLW
jgi:hypothetical protein